MTESLRDRLYTAEAIVLARRDLGESDRIFDVYSRRHGRFSMIAKRARRPDNRDGRSLDLLNQVAVQLYRGRNLDIVKGVEVEATHDGLRTDLDAFGHACYIAELVRVMTHDREPNERLFALLSQCLSLLAEGVAPWPVARYFEYALLEASGFQPQLFTCARCREPLTAQVNAFSVREGGVLCPQCQVGDPGGVALSVNAQKYLRTMERDGLRRTLALRLDPVAQGQVQRALTDYVQHIAERPIASLKIMAAMRGNGSLLQGRGTSENASGTAAPDDQAVVS